MPENHTDDGSLSIDYSPLKSNLKIDRWSPISIVAYILTGLFICVTLLLLMALIANFDLPIVVIVLAAIAISALCILGSRALFHRTNPAHPNDLLSFAEANGLSIYSNPPSSHLDATVRIRLKYSIFSEPVPWHYQTTLWLMGNYKSHAFSMYNATLDYGVLTGSTIEEGMQHAYYENRDSQTSIALTLHRTGRMGVLAARNCGIILWTLPNLSPDAMKQIRRVAARHMEDVQTNGSQLALLLPTMLPYGKKSMTKLYQVLDRIYEVAEATTAPKE